MVMVDCSFCYFSGSSGFDSPATTNRRCDSVTGGKGPFQNRVISIFLVFIFSGSIPLPAPKRRDAASGQSSPEYVV